MRFRPNLRLRKTMRLFRRNLQSESAEEVAPLVEDLQVKERQLLEAQRVIQQLQEQLEEYAAEVDALRRIGAAVGSAFEVDETLNALVEVACASLAQNPATSTCSTKIAPSWCFAPPMKRHVAWWARYG